MSSGLVASSAPAKVILFGEHAVVYGQPAIAVPVSEVVATATVEPGPTGSALTLVAADLGHRFTLTEAPLHNPLAVAARLTLNFLSASAPDATITVRSSIPIAGGLGSGAAVSTALVRALASFIGHSLSRGEVSRLVFEVEKVHHGTPSGIDNTVIAYEQPVYFVREAPSGPEREAPSGPEREAPSGPEREAPSGPEREAPSGPERLSVAAPFTLLIIDSGLPSPTKQLVGRVRDRWLRDPEGCATLFRQIGDIAREARHHIEAGAVHALGPLMDKNHTLLIELDVSSPTLNRLVDVARDAGASGAKLSGAGHGGSVVALIQAEQVDAAIASLRKAGAARVIHTTVE